MKIIFSYLEDFWKSQFWLTPALIILALIGLQMGLQFIDLETEEETLFWQVFHHSSAEGAREVLATIAGSLITVVGVLFSVTMLVIQQLGAQYTPRMIQNFTRSMPSQVLLGAYIGTFCYCLLVLRKIHGGNGGEEATVPEVAISIGILLAIFCLGLLVYYIHYLIQSFKSTTVIANATQEALAAIKRVYEDSDKADRTRGNFYSEQEFPCCSLICSQQAGYLNMFRWKGLNRIRILRQGSWLIKLLVTPGDYVHEGQPLLEIHGWDEVEDKAKKKIYSLFSLSQERIHAQDPRFGIREVVDMALRALSPSTNDPTTATEALNRLGDILKTLTLTQLANGPLSLKGDNLLQLKQPGYEEFLDLCFQQILLMAQTNPNPTIFKRILGIVRVCQRQCPEASKLQALYAMEREVIAIISNTENLGPFQKQELIRQSQ
jgi:uncharacterized membrane protein